MNTFYSDLHIVRTNIDTSFYTIKMPAGLIFVNRTGSRVQSGILTKEINVPVSGCQGDTSTVYIGLACITEAMGLPWADNTYDDTRNYPIAKNMHTPMVITNDPNLLAILDILKDKPGLTLTRHYNPFDALADDYVMPDWLKIHDQIQQVIWSVTDGHGVTRKERDALVDALKAYE